MTPAAIGILAALFLLVAMAGFVVLIGFADAWLMHRWGVEATISRGMQRMGKIWPVIPFLIGMVIGLTVGVLSGHFWMNQIPLP